MFSTPGFIQPLGSCLLTATPGYYLYPGCVNATVVCTPKWIWAHISRGSIISSCCCILNNLPELPGEELRGPGDSSRRADVAAPPGRTRAKTVTQTLTEMEENMIYIFRITSILLNTPAPVFLLTGWGIFIKILTSSCSWAVILRKKITENTNLCFPFRSFSKVILIIDEKRATTNRTEQPQMIVIVKK